MIVIGSDPHMRGYSFTTGGHERMLAWARTIGADRVWAIEDCRHVSGKLERFLRARGERVVRVAPHPMAGRRRGLRQAGKCDPIDALAVARAALEGGVETLPIARLEGPTREIKLLLDHREDLIGERTRIQNRRRWLLHERWPELVLPTDALTAPPDSRNSLAAWPVPARTPTCA
jgi:transposase